MLEGIWNATSYVRVNKEFHVTRQIELTRSTKLTCRIQLNGCFIQENSPTNLEFRQLVIVVLAVLFTT